MRLNAITTITLRLRPRFQLQSNCDQSWMSKLCTGQCLRFSSLRTELDPRDRQYLYVKRYGGHLLGHVGSFRSLRSPPKLLTLELTYIPPQDIDISWKTWKLAMNPLMGFTSEIIVPCSIIKGTGSNLVTWEQVLMVHIQSCMVHLSQYLRQQTGLNSIRQKANKFLWEHSAFSTSCVSNSSKRRYQK